MFVFMLYAQTIEYIVFYFKDEVKKIERRKNFRVLYIFTVCRAEILGKTFLTKKNYPSFVREKNYSASDIKKLLSTSLRT